MNYQAINKNVFQQMKGQDLLHLLLRQRGIEDVTTFLTLPHEVLHDPFLLKNMEAGIQLLTKHLTNKNKICILVD